MQDMSDYSGINLFVGTADAMQAIPEESKHYALLMTLNDQGQIIGFDYHDPIRGKLDVLTELADPQHILDQIQRISQARSLSFDMEHTQMIHLKPEQIRDVFPSLLKRHIKPERQYAAEFYSNLEHQEKFNRKDSGLSHSYLKNSQYGLIQLENKGECRVVWNASIPNQSIFDNLPVNTSAAYVVFGNNLYYIKNDTTSSSKLISKLDADSLEYVKGFKLSNRGLSHDEITDLDVNVHKKDKKNEYGSGGYARVKKANTLIDEKRVELATKIQKLKRKGRFESQHGAGGRGAQELNLENEAAIIGDRSQGSSHVQLGTNKAYIHMKALGEPITVKTKNADTTKKIDYAIKFLIEVDRIHQGEGSETSTQYAHRDLKPPNVLVDDQDNLHIIDPGLATTDLQNKNAEAGGSIYYAPLDQDVINHYLKPLKEPPILVDNIVADSINSNLDNEVHVFSDDDNDIIEEFDTNLSPAISHVLPISTPEIAGNSSSFLPEKWILCLGIPELCLTENYLEEDKIAALRTIYCNPMPRDKNEICSILDFNDFARLPKPIQNLLDTKTIAPLLTEARRQETEAMFAAVLIQYQENPHLGDEEYSEFIDQLRYDPELQQCIIKNYQLSHSTRANCEDSADKPIEIQDKELSNIVSENLAAFKGKVKIKPAPEIFEEKKSWFQHIKAKFTKSRSRSSASVSPDSLESDDTNSNKENIDNRYYKKEKK